jgi:hypothetical protein
MTPFADCAEIRLALGVYVVGAIEPAERALVDAHLAGCPACREELAGMAGLPALLGRIPVHDAERLADGARAADLAEPPPELLQALLRRVAARHRARRWRLLTAAAAAVVIAIGGGVAVGLRVAEGTGHTAPRPAGELALGHDPATQVGARVDFAPTAWGGTAMRVQVSGIPGGTRCRFWVVTTDGRRLLAGTWTVTASYGSNWYPASSPVAMSAVRSFEVTAGSRLLVTVPV